MAKKRIVVMFNVKPGADPATLGNLKKMMVEEFIPAEKQAPGLISIEAVERYSDPIPHEPNNSASDFAFVELWKDAESNHDWWAGNMFSPKSARMKEVMQKFKAFMGSPEGKYVEFLDCHFSVIE
ncbi:hypothetical protein AMJ74_00550 [candidate division WOR_3 bacterium SM1_77]|uniref:ABM domain-containing protein n=1 Tax=candidate division WOR_3 bacterium SM1_77 TaxID=1703778 RepID=A0A0S8K278_UNCW3|nr:MAG: hypothetical protein AMJ74_00550 [candidate division WOR_3 bacterium SM1_77]